MTLEEWRRRMLEIIPDHLEYVGDPGKEDSLCLDGYFSSEELRKLADLLVEWLK